MKGGSLEAEFFVCLVLGVFWFFFFLCVCGGTRNGTEGLIHGGRA